MTQHPALGIPFWSDEEIAARIAESPSLYRLLAPIRRLSGMDVPIPYAPQLESAVVPQVPDIVEAAHALVKES